MKRRLIYAALSAICLAICFIIVKFFECNLFIRGFAGDVIVVLLIYFIFRALYDFKPGRLVIFVLVFSYAVEFLQYFKLISAFGLQNNRLAQIILGSVFDPRDLAAYTIGAVLVYFLDVKLITFSIKTLDKAGLVKLK